MIIFVEKYRNSKLLTLSMYEYPVFTCQNSQACVADGTLFVKSYGAQKIYCIPQAGPVQSGSSDNPVEVLKERLADLNIVRRQLQDQCDEIGRRLRFHVQAKSVDMACSQCLAEIAAFHNQIAKIEYSRSGQESDHNEDTGDKIEEEISSLMSELNRRRRMAMNMVEQISEFSCISKKEVISDLGLETEAVGVFRGE